jgi:uncharacterized Zn finger protein (UPF0148 family)
VVRFRLRFLLQEHDLPPGETVLGRSPDCHITIEDPLISRQHARIVVENGTVTFYDLGSRNGSRINGRPISGSQVLADQDRVRLGAQELVFFRMETSQFAPRSTGAMRLCGRCKTPFPEGPLVCPHCGHSVTAVREEETVPGISVPVRRAWIAQMFGDFMDRALPQGKFAEADRILRRAAEEAEERIASADIDAAYLARIAEYALKLAMLKRDARWVCWVLDAYRRAKKIPPAHIVAGLAGVSDLAGFREALGRLIATYQAEGSPVAEEDGPQLAALELMLEQPAETASSATSTTEDPAVG